MASYRIETASDGSEAINSPLIASNPEGVVYIVRNDVATPLSDETALQQDDLIVAAPGAKYVVMKNGVPVVVNEPVRPVCV